MAADSAKALARARPGASWQAFLRSRARDIAVAVLLTLACGWLAQRVAPPEGSTLSRSAAAYPATSLLGRTKITRQPAARAASPAGEPEVATRGARNQSLAVDVADRRAGAVLGSFTADAAAMGLHWCGRRPGH